MTEGLSKQLFPRSVGNNEIRSTVKLLEMNILRI